MQLSLLACGTAERATPAGDTSLATAPAADGAPAAVQAETLLITVNRGAPGMAARIRWLLSPDRRSIILVEDPAGVEAEPVPNGFVFASEATGRVVQQDSVWDVAPSPDWRQLAWGRAYGPRPGERDSMSTAEWRAFVSTIPGSLTSALQPGASAGAGRDSLVAVLRRSAFPSSGMTYAVAIGVAHVLDLRNESAPTPLSWHGWRVRWTPDGSILGIGTDPAGVQDDSPPRRWILLRPPSGDSIGSASDSRSFVENRWVVGPVLDISIEEPPRELVATRDRRFVAALVPNTGAGEYDPKTRLVMYHIRNR
jgi:hypothetical protein